MSDLSIPPHEHQFATTAADQRIDYDNQRHRCPVSRDQHGHWHVLGHAQVSQVLHDHAQFSSRVSQYLSVPNGMDPPEHTAYRQVIEPYFSQQRMHAFAPICQALAEQLTQVAFNTDTIELMSALATPFALHIQCAFMGWPESMQAPLNSWMQRSEQASRNRNRSALSQLAAEFEEMISTLLQSRRQATAEQDLTAALLHERVNGQALTDQEITSILRNWTVGEIGTIAAAIGILAQYLAEHPQLQQQLRNEPDLLPAAIDEILRIHGPLIDNRRVTRCPVQLGDQSIAADQRLIINWVAANRDPAVFADPQQFSLDRNPALNLLYGAGIHVCPGAPLARMELLYIVQAMLNHSSTLQLCKGQPAVLARYPASGYAQLPLQVR